MSLAMMYNCSPCVIRTRLQNAGIEIRTYVTELTKQHQALAKEGCSLTEERKHRISATLQGQTYDEWEKYASEQLYCSLFNEKCRESNREKYDRRCFLTGLPEKENITSTGKQKKLSVHHYDMDKGQGCNGKRWKLVPLCMKWYSRSHTKEWEARITWLLENVWV